MRSKIKFAARQNLISISSLFFVMSISTLVFFLKVLYVQGKCGLNYAHTLCTNKAAPSQIQSCNLSLFVMRQVNILNLTMTPIQRWYTNIHIRIWGYVLSGFVWWCWCDIAQMLSPLGLSGRVTVTVAFDLSQHSHYVHITSDFYSTNSHSKCCTVYCHLIDL